MGQPSLPQSLTMTARAHEEVGPRVVGATQSVPGQCPHGPRPYMLPKSFTEFDRRFERNLQACAHVVCVKGQFEGSSRQEVLRWCGKHAWASEDHGPHIRPGVIDDRREDSGRDLQRLDEQQGSGVVTKGEVEPYLGVAIGSP